MKLCAYLWSHADISAKNVVFLVVALLIVDFKLRCFGCCGSLLLCVRFILIFQLFVFEIDEKLYGGLGSIEMGDAEGHPFLYELNGIIQMINRTQFET